MPKVANTADLHARGKDLPAFRRQWQAVFDECDERGVDLITVAGDVFDKQNIYDKVASTGDIANAVISPIATTMIPVIVVVGNHDRENPTDMDGCAILEGFPHVIVVREPRWVHSAINVACVPWMYTRGAEDVIRELHDQPVPGPRLLVSHVQVAGGVMNGGMISEGGHFSVTQPFLKSLDFDRVALGDFHKRQDFGRGGYVGALRQLHHGHADEPQGFEIWDTETDEVTWVELNEAPRYETIEWQEGEDKPERKDGVITKIRTVGWVPNNLDTKELEDDGFRVEPVVERIERTARVTELPEGAIGKPHDLLDLWAGEQAPPPDTKPLHVELDSVLAA